MARCFASLSLHSSFAKLTCLAESLPKPPTPTPRLGRRVLASISHVCPQRSVRNGGMCSPLTLPILPAAEEAQSPCPHFRSFPQLEGNSSYNSSHLYEASQLR